MQHISFMWGQYEIQNKILLSFIMSSCINSIFVMLLINPNEPKSLFGLFFTIQNYNNYTSNIF